MFKAKVKTHFNTIFSVIFKQLSTAYQLFSIAIKMNIFLLISFWDK
jgi:hypothetical protein